MKTIVYWTARLVRVYQILIFIRVLISWIPVDRNNRLIDALFQLTEPVLAPIRRIMPRTGMIDFSPVIALLILSFIERTLWYSLM
ncbi:MAG: YggT family protein [Limnochordia bacterium]|jgi:YggT family protein|nr:YggT family protein [Limnochordia bacterium]MDD2630157.1 YggT family protein [Limnochordia bacterium]MDD4518910.1 YggT family protein [Limnochordia bacterium]